MAHSKQVDSSEIIHMLEAAGQGYLSGQTLAEALGVSRTAIWKQVQGLKSEGYEIVSVTNRGYKLMRKADPLSVEAIREGLETEALGCALFYFDSVDSTQAIAKEKAPISPHGTVVVANKQTNGKGRLGRSWHSPHGLGVYMSLIVKPNISPAQSPQLTLLTAIAVVDTLAKFGVDAGIKWPNDCLVAGKKISGVLTEMAADADQIQHVIIGVGLNVNHSAHDFTAEITPIVTSMKMSLGLENATMIPRSEVIQVFLLEWEKLFALYLREGFAPIKEKWELRSNIVGRNIKVTMMKRELYGVAIGVTEAGALLVKDSQERVEAVFSGDIQFL